MCNVLGFYFQQWTEQYCPLLSVRSWNQTPSPVAESSQASGLKLGGASSVKDDSARSTTEPRLPVSDPQWQWLSYDKFEDKKGNIQLKKCGESKNSAKTDDGPFKVYYRRRVHTLWPDVMEVIVTSPSLVRTLQQYLPDHGDLKSLAKPKVDGRDLYVVLQSLKYHDFKARAKSSRGYHLENNLAANGSQPADGDNHRAIMGEGAKKDTGTKNKAASDVLHAKHLVRFLEEEYKDVLKRESRMRMEKQVSWDMLWIFLSKGTKVGYFCDLSGQLLCAMVAGSYYKYKLYENYWSLRVELEVWDFNGTSYNTCKIFREIEMFHQERHFSELTVCPIEILGDPSVLNDMLFLDNGRKFYDLAVKSSNRFMLYGGPLYQKRRNGACWLLYREKGDGRVMIDLCSFAAMNPDYPMGNAQPPMTGSFKSRRVGLTGKCLSAFYENNPSPITITPTSGSNSVRKQEKVSDSNLIFAPAVVYGFSFKLKKWGCFAVSQFSEVVFDREAFRELNMEPEMKSLMHNLVKQYVSSGDDPMKSSERVDPIAGKGEGCIFLCHGPPGTGKTLTAESIAENFGRPLWAMGVTELGTTVELLEETLLKVLDIAARWKAVLLLDEADIYLENRSSGASVVRNAMTGVFLRELEYYRGVLFLTTNRIGTFDDAFRSRISLFLHYRELGLAEKTKIWNTLLGRAKVEDVTDEFSKEMAGQNLNGRDIRNTIHTAQVWAKSTGERLAARHVKYVVGVFANSITDLNQVLTRS